MGVIFFHTRRSLEIEATGEVSVLTMRSREESLWFSHPSLHGAKKAASGLGRKRGDEIPPTTFCLLQESKSLLRHLRRTTSVLLAKLGHGTALSCKGNTKSAKRKWGYHVDELPGTEYMAPSNKTKKEGGGGQARSNKRAAQPCLPHLLGRELAALDQCPLIFGKWNLLVLEMLNTGNLWNKGLVFKTRFLCSPELLRGCC